MIRLIFLLVYYGRFCLGNLVEPSFVSLGEGDSLYLEWNTGLKDIIWCKALSPSHVSYTLQPDLRTRVQYYGEGFREGHCGLHISQVTRKDDGNWMLFAADEKNKGRQMVGDATVHVTTDKEVRQTFNTSIELSSYAVLPCGHLTQLNGDQYCQIIDPAGLASEHRTQCKRIIHLVTKNHEGEWFCKIYDATRTTITIVSINVAIIRRTETRILNAGYNETDLKINIFCGAPIGQTIKFCEITTPGGDVFMMAPGRGRSRYKYFGFSQLDCGMTIRKPLREYERGIWKCAAKTQFGKAYGGYVAVGREEDLELKPSQEQLIIRKNDHLQISCNIRTAIRYCWIGYPDGTLISVDPSQSGYGGTGFNYGECGITIDDCSSRNCSGSWTCRVTLPERDKELSTKIVVTVAEEPVFSRNTEIIVSSGESFKIGCETIGNVAAKYCRIYNPKNESFLASSAIREKSNGRLSYDGNLSRGSCSVNVSVAREEDFGSWFCSMAFENVSHNGGEGMISIMVKEREENSGWKYTILVLNLVILCIVWKYRAKIINFILANNHHRIH